LFDEVENQYDLIRGGWEHTLRGVSCSLRLTTYLGHVHDCVHVPERVPKSEHGHGRDRDRDCDYACASDLLVVLVVLTLRRYSATCLGFCSMERVDYGLLRLIRRVRVMGSVHISSRGRLTGHRILVKSTPTPTVNLHHRPSGSRRSSPPYSLEYCAYSVRTLSRHLQYSPAYSIELQVISLHDIRTTPPSRCALQYIFHIITSYIQKHDIFSHTITDDIIPPP
jgi:hypothetical protein